jgi:hypothetical protein
MNAWTVDGVEFPFGDEIRSWRVDASGAIHDRPLVSAEPPGRLSCLGLLTLTPTPPSAPGRRG